MNLTYAWKFKVATKNREESKVSSDKQWTEHINTSIHVLSKNCGTAFIATRVLVYNLRQQQEVQRLYMRIA